ncbi:MAG: hypothetical protein LBK54_11570 [Propionibacteriaceae bacterium]|nr:hypothetical protein [Propionibacteriaceae bacterium]
MPANALVFSVCCTLPAIGLLYASDSIMMAFTYASTTATVLFIFVWSVILVSYLVYRKRRPQLHQASVYKMPFGAPMCWIVFVFFGVSLVILGLDPDTLIGEVFVPVWFLVMFVASHSRQQLAPASVRVSTPLARRRRRSRLRPGTGPGVRAENPNSGQSRDR